MKPLEQWVCDNCGQLISEVGHGYVEWLHEGEPGNYRSHGFRIVHHAPRSPMRSLGGDCYKYTKHRGRRDIDLEYFVGTKGLVQMLSFLHVGRLDPEYRSLSIQKADMPEFVEVWRRLQLPYYEEARIYWPRALDDGFFEGANEIWMYLPDTLKEIIERYGEDE